MCKCLNLNKYHKAKVNHPSDTYSCIIQLKQILGKVLHLPHGAKPIVLKNKPQYTFLFWKISWEKSLGQNYMSEFLWKWAFSLKLLVYKYFKIDFCRNFEVIIFLTRITWHITLSFSHFFCRLAKFAHLSRDLKG